MLCGDFVDPCHSTSLSNDFICFRLDPPASRESTAMLPRTHQSNNPTESGSRSRSRPSVLLPSEELRSGIPTRMHGATPCRATLSIGIATTVNAQTISRPVEPTRPSTNKSTESLKLKDRSKSTQDTQCCARTLPLPQRSDEHVDPTSSRQANNRTPLAPFASQQVTTTLRLRHDSSDHTSSEKVQHQSTPTAESIPLEDFIPIPPTANETQSPAIKLAEQTQETTIPDAPEQEQDPIIRLVEYPQPQTDTEDPLPQATLQKEDLSSPPTLVSQLARVVDAWPHLSAEIQSAILTLIENARSEN